MPRGTDTSSWAYRMSISDAHRQLLVRMAEDNLSWAERTGTQSASERPAKPPLVGSNPTPCSKSTAEKSNDPQTTM